LSTQLIKYEAARHALSEAVEFDEVMSIMNVAEQAALYAKQANDNELVEKATEIRVRAQRKAGEMLTLGKQRGDRASQADAGKIGAAERWNSGSDAATSHAPTLAEIGITKDQSSRWQSLASMSDEHFETAVETAKSTAGEVTTAFMLREAQKAKPQGKAPTGPKADAMREELQAAKERGVSMLETYARLTLTAVRAQDSFTEQERALLAVLMEAIAAATA
jgi:hypothetical protein